MDYVYLIGAYNFRGDLIAVKIGKAREPEKRLASLQTGCPTPLKLLAALRGNIHNWSSTKSFEAHLHEKFSPMRIRGEWFGPDIHILEFFGVPATQYQWSEQLAYLRKLRSWWTNKAVPDTYQTSVDTFLWWLRNEGPYWPEWFDISDEEYHPGRALMSFAWKFNATSNGSITIPCALAWVAGYVLTTDAELHNALPEVPIDNVLFSLEDSIKNYLLHDSMHSVLGAICSGAWLESAYLTEEPRRI